MVVELKTFGSIFLYRDDFYVYLGLTPSGRLFAARILDPYGTKVLQDTSDRVESRPPGAPLKGSLALCFVILTTNDFQNQAASLHRTGDHVDEERDVQFDGRSLNADDVKSLKEMILDDPAIPVSLSKLVRELDE